MKGKEKTTTFEWYRYYIYQVPVDKIKSRPALFPAQCFVLLRCIA